MKHAVYVPPFGTFGDPGVLVELAVAAESAGWDAFFLWDHVQYQEPVAFVDPWVALAAVACATQRLRLGALITPLARRRPWKVARETVTLDHLSGGRLVFGAGLGIDFWGEFSSFAEEAGDDRRRAALLDEGLEILTALWSGQPVRHDGELKVDARPFLPRPLQQPRIPVWTAAIWPLRAGPVRRAARWDGIVPFNATGTFTPDHVRTIVDTIRRHRPADAPFDVCLHAHGQDPGALAEAGVTWLMDSFWPEAPLDRVRRTIEAGPPA